MRSRRSVVHAGFGSSQPLSTSSPLRSIVKFTGIRQMRPYPPAYALPSKPTGKLKPVATCRTAARSSCPSRLNPRTRRPLAAWRAAYSDNSGSSVRHGSHHVAQNVRMTTSPRKSSLATLCPLGVCRTRLGAGRPMARLLACAGGCQPPILAPNANPAVMRNQSRLEPASPMRRNFSTSERIACPYSTGPTGEELIPAESAINRLLDERVQVKILHNVHRHSWR